MTLYHDPSRPDKKSSLIGDLLKLPATPEQHQLENQATAVLAWLADNSFQIARVALALFLGAPGMIVGDSEALPGWRLVV